MKTDENMQHSVFIEGILSATVAERKEKETIKIELENVKMRLKREKMDRDVELKKM